MPLTLMATLPMEDLAGDAHAVGPSDAKWRGATLKQFMPDRWLDDDGQFDASVGVQSLPFSAGQRGCFGKALAVSSRCGALDSIAKLKSRIRFSSSRPCWQRSTLHSSSTRFLLNTTMTSLWNLSRESQRSRMCDRCPGKRRGVHRPCVLVDDFERLDVCLYKNGGRSVEPISC